MVDSTLLPAIREAIKQNEIGNGSPYKLSFARLGQSGASFGIFQGDTNVNSLAQRTLKQVLGAAGADQATIQRISALLDRPCPHGNPLTQADAQLTDGALTSQAGRQLVDSMDDALLHTVLGYIDDCLAAAERRDFGIAPAAHLHIALWTNMTGKPTTLSAWIGGKPVAGLSPPRGPSVNGDDMTAYLKAQNYFKQHPQNFVHFTQSVAAAVPLLPVA